MINPSNTDIIISNQLMKIIHDDLSYHNGTIPLNQFIQLALYHKQYGYYNNQHDKFNNNGDFITAPHVSILFAKCLATQINELICNHDIDVCSNHGSDLKRINNILEIGAGDGLLLYNLLPLLADSIDCYYILEQSAYLITQQKQIISKLPESLQDKIIWLFELPNNFNGIIIANELFDALPCTQFTIDHGNIYLTNIVNNKSNNELTYSYQKCYDDNLIGYIHSIPYLKMILDSNRHYTSEISYDSEKLIKNIANIIDTGAIILIDYGCGENEYYSNKYNNGSLRGFYKQHQLDNILQYPGIIDITTNVNFSLLTKNALDCGLDLIGYTTQASFLLNCQLLDHANCYNNLNNDNLNDSNCRANTKKTQLILNNQINQLTSPNIMGEIFKVIGFSKNLNTDEWIGFKNFSLHHLL